MCGSRRPSDYQLQSSKALGGRWVENRKEQFAFLVSSSVLERSFDGCCGPPRALGGVNPRSLFTPSPPPRQPNNKHSAPRLGPSRCFSSVPPLAVPKKKASSRFSFPEGGKESWRLVTHLQLERPPHRADGSPDFVLSPRAWRSPAAVGITRAACWGSGRRKRLCNGF